MYKALSLILAVLIITFISPGIRPAFAQTVPSVLGTQGRHVVVRSHVPGTPATFRLPDVQLPATVFVKLHGAASSTAMRVTPIPVQLRSGHSRTAAGNVAVPGVRFIVPQLPKGIYDAWYTGGHPTVPTGMRPSQLPAADPTASQSLTFEIRPRLHGRKAPIQVGDAGVAIQGIVVGLMRDLTTSYGTQLGRRAQPSHIITEKR